VQLDLLGHRYAVFGYRRTTPTLVQHSVPPARPERRLHRPGKLLNPGKQLGAGIVLKREILGGHKWFLVRFVFGFRGWIDD